MNSYPLREGFKKGVVFAIVMIFLVMIEFHVIAATLVSKVFSVNVLRGAIPEVRFMTLVHLLFGIWAGWSTSGKKGSTSSKILQGGAAGFTAGFFIALFDLVLNFLIQSGLDVREYLSALSFNSMKYFLLNLGQMGTLLHLGLYTATGFVGSALAVFMRSDSIQHFWQNLISKVSKFFTHIYGVLPSFVIKFGKYFIYLVLLAAFFIIPTKWGSYWNYVIGLVGLYIIAGVGLNIIVGLSGQLVLGYAAFFAMGAYSVGILNAPEPHHLMWGFWPALIIGVIMAVLAAVVLGLPIMRLRGDYLAIVTLGFGEIIRILLKSDTLIDFTGGPHGIHDIHGPTLFGKPFSSDVDYVYLIFAGVALTIFLYTRLQDSRTGRAWLATKEDAIAAQATGVNLQKYKLLALCLGAAFAGLAGGIFAARNQFTGPNDHTLMVSINILSIIIVGGANSIPGIILGAFALKGLPEILREIENYRLLGFGALLIVMMLVRPNGLWPASRPMMEKAGRSKLEAAKPKKGAKDD
jgi:ABC-type branched-subunit amino acid transport system permease subunit